MKLNFPTLSVKPGDKIIDAGAGFGDTAIKLARLVGPSGSVLAVDCIGPAGEVYREAGTLAVERHEEIAAALRAQLAKYRGPKGVMMDSDSWKVTARNPD